MKKTVPELLREGAETYEQRNALYRDNYKRIGAIMQVLFPEGLPAMTPEGHNRFCTWFMAFGKLVRYAMQLEHGGHSDSAHDAMVYAAMLEELTPPPAGRPPQVDGCCGDKDDCIYGAGACVFK